MDENKKKFLQLMSMMESSGGKNVAHSRVPAGVQAGDTAYGQYGLMPNTVKEMATRRNNAGIGDKMDAQMVNIDNNQVGNVLTAHPELEQRYAQDLANNALNKSNGNMVDAAYRWRWGQNMPDDKLQNVESSNPDYLDRLNKILGNK